MPKRHWRIAQDYREPGGFWFLSAAWSGDHLREQCPAYLLVQRATTRGQALALLRERCEGDHRWPGLLVDPKEPLLSETAAALLAEAERLGGMEVPESWWDAAEQLVTSGKATLSEAHGPGQKWRWLAPVPTEDDPVLAMERHLEGMGIQT